MDTIQFAHEDGIGVITLSREKALNALNFDPPNEASPMCSPRLMNSWPSRLGHHGRRRPAHSLPERTYQRDGQLLRRRGRLRRRSGGARAHRALPRTHHRCREGFRYRRRRGGRDGLRHDPGGSNGRVRTARRSKLGVFLGFGGTQRLRRVGHVSARSSTMTTAGMSKPMRRSPSESPWMLSRRGTS